MEQKRIKEEILLNEIISNIDEHKTHQTFFEGVNKKIKGSNKSYIASVNIENFSIFTKWHGA